MTSFYANTTLMLSKSGFWWPKLSKQSLTSRTCLQHISPSTSVINIDVASQSFIQNYWSGRRTPVNLKFYMLHSKVYKLILINKNDLSRFDFLMKSINFFDNSILIECLQFWRLQISIQKFFLVYIFEVCQKRVFG